MKYLKLFEDHANEETCPVCSGTGKVKVTNENSLEVSAEDEKLANQIYSKIEKLEPSEFSIISSEILSCTCDDDMITVYEKDQKIFIQDFMYGKREDGLSIHVSKQTIDKFVELFKRKLKESGESYKSDVLKRYSY